MKRYNLNLFLFDGEGAAAGAAVGGEGGADAMAAEVMPEAPENTKRLKAHPLANVRYGKSDEQANGDTSAEEAQIDPEQEWTELKKGKYKEQYGRDVQAAVQERFKNQADVEGVLDSIRPALDALIKQRGLTEGDYDNLIANIMDDDSLYEEEALERGVSVDTLKQIKQLEADNERYRQQEQMDIEQRRFNDHIQMLATQGEQLKQIYPGFDLRTELQNPQFANLTKPGSGIDVKTAYEVVHHNELQNGMMQAAVQVSQQKFASAMHNNRSRPVEGGTRRSAAIEVRNDPTKLSKADREEIRRRVKMGDRSISW